MKLLIDFQACQSEARNRGIGRYAFGLLKALAQNGSLSETTLHVNTTLTGTDDPLLKEIISLSPKTQVVAEKYLSMDYFPDKQKNREANVIKFSNIASDYDGVLFIDPMEGGNFNFTPNSKVNLPANIWCGAVIHDFIPLIFSEVYLSDPENRRNYHRKLQFVRTCDCLLSNSEHTKKDAVNLLDISPSRITNILGGTEHMFKITTGSFDELQFLGIKKNYILYLAANGPHKNIAGAVKAFALLPADFKKHFQLVIACKLQEAVENDLKKLALDVGLSESSVIFTGFISDEILIKLYNFASLFVFTSFYEGLGFPILEAIRCGTPVLAGDNSSQPEVVGTEGALFDASSPQSIADKIKYALNNPKWLKGLKDKQRRHAENFTWEKSAEKAWAAIENSYAEFRKNNHLYHRSRPRIAWFTPLPPQQTGLSNYNAGLIPHLTQDFDIDLIIDDGYSVEDDYLGANYHILSVKEFEEKHRQNAYDQCLYQIGNSHYHAFMLPFIEKYGGAVVLHDTYLDKIARFGESQSQINSSNSFISKAFACAPELARQKELFNVDSDEYSHIISNAVLSYMINCADGVLLHSKRAYDMFRKMLPMHSCPIIISELGTSVPMLLTEREKKQLRNKLGVEEGKMICSVWGITQKKETEYVIETLSQLSPKTKRKTIFFIVVEHHENHEKWLDTLLSQASSAEVNMRSTGYVDDKLLLEYMNISDIALSLGISSRCESNVSILNLLSRGIPSIVYDMGYFSEIDDKAVLKVPLADTGVLMNQIERLMKSEELRKITSQHARDFAKLLHWPTRAEGYRDLIYKSIEYQTRVKKYAEMICLINSETV